MAEYIEREDAERCAEKLINHPKEDGFRDSIEILNAIHSLPAADVRPVMRGRWSRIDYEPHGHDYKCSACEWKNDMPKHFCPNCGADMRPSEVDS